MAGRLFLPTGITYCVEGVEGGVVPGGSHTSILCGSPVTHPCKGCHAPAGGRGKGSIPQLLLGAHIVQHTNTAFTL